MVATAFVVLGLLIGWLVEWVLDWFYWRRKIRAAVAENATLKERITALQAQKNQRLLSAKNLPLIRPDGSENLQAIKGIGPAFAKRLNDAGITTFEQLSRLKPKELDEILGTLYRRFFSKQEKILAQAKEFAKLVAQHR